MIMGKLEALQVFNFKTCIKLKHFHQFTKFSTFKRLVTGIVYQNEISTKLLVGRKSYESGPIEKRAKPSFIEKNIIISI